MAAVTGPVAGPEVLELATSAVGAVWALAVARLADGRVLLAAGDAAGRIFRWDGVTGARLGDPVATARDAVRGMVAAALPDGRVLLASADSHGGVQVWDGGTGASTGVTIAPGAGQVWSMATLTTAEHPALLFTGGDDGRVRRWDALTGELVGSPFADHVSAVRAMIITRLVDGRPVVVTGGDDGSVRWWDALTGRSLLSSAARHPGQIWGMALARLPSGATLATSGNDSLLFRWDADTGTLMGEPVSAGGGAVPTVVSAALPSGRVLLVTGNTNGWLYCWDAATGAPVGRPRRTVGRCGVQSLATITTADGEVRLVVGGSDGKVTVQPVPWADPADPRTDASALVDSVRVTDALGRRILASHLGALLGELAKNTASTSAVVHVDGQWGSGKSTLVELLLRDPGPFGRDLVDPLVVRYEAWREAAIGPEWWSLSTSIAREVRRSRSRWTRALMLGWNLLVRTARSPASMTALALLGLSLLGWLAAPSQDVQAVGAVVTAVVGLATLAQAAGRALFWHSPPFARLHLRTEDNPLGQVADLVWWLRRWAPREPARQRRRDAVVGVAVTGLVVFAVAALPAAAVGTTWPGRPVVVGSLAAVAVVLGAVVVWHVRWCRRLPGSRRPILLVIDDLDRCRAERVVKLLETVHTILRQPAPANPAGWREPACLFVLVLADGRWIRQAFAAAFAEFEDATSATHNLGSDFTQKLFDHTVLVPALSAEQVSDYLATQIGPRAGSASPDETTHGGISPVGAAVRATVEDADPTDLRSPQVDHALADPALSSADREAVEVARVRREATAAATASRADHLLQKYADLMPANPRLIKRVANTFGMLLAIKSHIQHTEAEDATARAAILLVRFPALAEQLRTQHLAAGAGLDADPLWQRPDVQQVLGDCDLTTLARCLGYGARADSARVETTSLAPTRSSARSTPADSDHETGDAADPVGTQPPEPLTQPAQPAATAQP